MIEAELNHLKKFTEYVNLTELLIWSQNSSEVQKSKRHPDNLQVPSGSV